MAEASVRYETTGVITNVFLTTTAGGQQTTHILLSGTKAAAGGGVQLLTSQMVRYYADPGTSVSMFADSNGTGNAIPVSTFAISGYYVNLP